MPWDISMRKPIKEVIQALTQLILSGYAPEDYPPYYIMLDARSYLKEYEEELK